MSKLRSSPLLPLAGEGPDEGKDVSESVASFCPHPNPLPQAGEGTNGASRRTGLWRTHLACLLVIAAAIALPAHAAPIRLQLDAPAFAPELMNVAVYLPPDYDAAAVHRYPVLYVNDGQDMPAVGLESTLARLYGEQAIEPVIVVAIDMLRDRMGTYGLSDRAAGSEPAWRLTLRPHRHARA